MRRGRPTSERKGWLVAVRLAERHRRFLEARARASGTSVSEELRSCVEEAMRGTAPRSRPPTPEERQTFAQVFAALGLRPVRRRRS